MSFTSDISRFVQKANANLDVVVRKLALDLYKSIIEGTPVDTGRARGNWQTAIAVPVEAQIDRLDKDGQAAVAELSAIVGKFSAGEIIYLSNNLPYALRLEEGYSQQSPAGMVRINFTRVEQFLRQAVASLK